MFGKFFGSKQQASKKSDFEIENDDSEEQGMKSKKWKQESNVIDLIYHL